MVDVARNRRAILLMTVAMGAYALNDAFVKATAQSLPPGQILAVRGAFATLFTALLARSSSARPAWGLVAHPLVLLRCGLEIATALTSVLALALAPLATVSALMMVAPLLVGAAHTLGHGWQGQRLAVTVAGFAGVMLVAQPWNDSHAAGANAGIALALACAICLAARDLVTRRLPAALPTRSVGWITALSVLLAGLLLGLLENWPPLNATTLVLLALAAAAAAAGTLALIAACRDSDLAVVTPFRFSFILWSMAIGAIIWGEWPNATALAGMALILGAGVWACRNVREP